jgi:hypothetical protein
MTWTMTFYVLLKAYTAKKNYTSILMTKKRYGEIKDFYLFMNDGGDVQERYLEENTQAYAWLWKYNVIVLAKAEIVILRPTSSSQCSVA